MVDERKKWNEGKIAELKFYIRVMNKTKNYRVVSSTLLLSPFKFFHTKKAEKAVFELEIQP